MKVVLLLRLITIVSLSLLIAFLCFKYFVRKLLSDYKFFAIFSRKFYNYFYAIKKIDHLRINNFGYAPLDEDICTYSIELQYGIQLYKELIKNNTGNLINENCSIVEVGCGKGAGAEYLIKRFKPFKYIGVDFSKNAIEFCRNNYKHLKCAHFICADAQQLPFERNSIDVVINVESSHLYKNSSKFFIEVHRILKDDGIFLFTDYRRIHSYPIERLEKELTDAGFYISKKRIITPNILDACKLASDHRERLVEEVIPRYLKKYFRHYAILVGTKKFIMMENGEIIYVMYHLVKGNRLS